MSLSGHLEFEVQVKQLTPEGKSYPFEWIYKADWENNPSFITAEKKYREAYLTDSYPPLSPLTTYYTALVLLLKISANRKWRFEFARVRNIHMHMRIYISLLHSPILYINTFKIS